MLSTRLRDIRFLSLLILFLFSGKLFSQEPEDETTQLDTTDYVSLLYAGAIDYNLMIAASKGYIGEVNRLILKGADIFAESEQGVTPLIFAISNNRTAVSKILLEYGSDPNKLTLKHETPLIIAVKNANAEIAEALLRAGADINISDRFDATALHYAAVYDYLQIADLLLYYDASIDKKTTDGSTPLFSAIWAGNPDVADLLIQNGANTETRDNEGFTPFLMAAINGDTLLMELLFKKGVDIYAVNNSKHNALALTIISDKVDAAKYLLRIGNKWSDQGNGAIDPYNVASKYRRKEMLTILKNNQIPGDIEYKIDQVDMMVSSRFFLHDFYTGVSFSFKEPYLNGGIIIGLDTKLWYTRVLQKQSENMFYQYLSKGSVFYGGLFKDFALTDHAFKANYSISTSLSAGYSFGNLLKGTKIVPGNKFFIMPAAGLKWTKNFFSISVGIDYVKTSFYRVGPIWLRLGASYNLYFNNIRTNGKTLKWY
jgi:ankyrin repeat protein